MVENNIEHASDVEASVNAGNVTLYNAEGRSMSVQETDVDYWLSQGMLRVAFDPEVDLKELALALPAVKDAFSAFVNGVISDGIIDTNEAGLRAVAITSHNRLTSVLGRILTGIDSRFKVEDVGETVPMFDQDGNATVVAVEQKQMYLDDRGYSNRKEG